MSERSKKAMADGYYRSLAVWEHSALAEHLLRLPDADRRWRFHGTLTEGGVQAHARRVLRSRRCKVIGWFSGGVLRGSAELSWSPALTGEAAFSVEPEFRRDGVGIGLAERVRRAASNRRLETVIVYTEAGNMPMRRLAARLGAQTRMIDGEIEGRVAIGNADAFSFWSEFAEEEKGLLYAVARGWSRLWLGTSNAQPVPSEAKRLATPEPLG